MDREQFKQIRDLPNKTIEGNIRFEKINETKICSKVTIQNSMEIPLQLDIVYNPKVNSKTFNVSVQNVGPICRLDVDGHVHKDAGNSHKQFLLNEECPKKNLSDGYESYPELKGKTTKELFEYFCKIAQITHNGIIDIPEEMKLV